ncbi:glycosyltransferase family 4 protein, partial [Sulfurimonas sp.]
IDREFEWISNGVDLDELAQNEPLDENVLKQIAKDKFIIGYTGTVGVANALDSFCEAAKLLEENKEILFVIVGDGQEKKNLIQKYANVANILFVDAIAKKQVQSMLKLFDACYIGLKKENLFKYGVSPNKLYDYMYSAKPVVYAIDSGSSNIVNRAKCGLSVEAQNPRAIADATEKLYEMNQDEREKLGENAKMFILEHFTYDKLAQKYEKVMEKK